jgi:hypothetical protein
LCVYLAGAGALAAEQNDRVVLFTKISCTNLNGYLNKVQSLIGKIPSTKIQISNNTQIQISNNSNEIDISMWERLLAAIKILNRLIMTLCILGGG